MCILKGLPPVKIKDPNTGKYSQDYWETSKKMLSDMGFLDALRSYDKVWTECEKERGAPQTVK